MALGEEKGFRIWLSPRLGERPCGASIPATWKTSGRPCARPARPRTIQHVCHLRAVWSHARKWGVAEGECPVKGVELGRIDNARTRFLSPAELQELLAEVNGATRTPGNRAGGGPHRGAAGRVGGPDLGLRGPGEPDHLPHPHQDRQAPAFPMTPQLVAMLRRKAAARRPTWFS